LKLAHLCNFIADSLPFCADLTL